MEIVPGLHRLRTPMTSSALPWIMPYAFEEDGGVTLFDSGFGTPEATEWLTRQLDGLGYHPRDIRRLIVSHGHPDHLGMAAWIKEQAPACQMIMLRTEADWFRTARRHHSNFLAEVVPWLTRHGVSRDEAEQSINRATHEHEAGDDNRDSGDVATETERRSWTMEVTEPDVVIEDGEVLEVGEWRLRAVWTPGHTPGHLCVYEPEHRLMLTGDHVLSRITPNVGYTEDDERTGRNPLAEFLASLEKVAAYDTARALPAHEALIDDLPGRCAEIAHHHDRRLDEVLDALRSDALTAHQVSQRVTWNKPYDSFNAFKKRAALGETLSHLVLLESRGALHCVDEDGVVRWRRA